jgi:hypothetical protein
MKGQVVEQPDAIMNRTTSKETGMKGKIRRRAAVSSVAALSAGGLMLGFGATAHASAFETVLGSNVGIYIDHNVSSGKVGIPDLQPGDVIIADCWTRGQSLTTGNVWYKVSSEIYNHLGGSTSTILGWAHGGDVDSNNAFHRGDIPAC